MMNLTEYRRTAARLADYLPWAALVGSGVVLNKDGSFQRTAKFRGPDLDSAVAAELVAVAGRINNAVRRLGSGWSIFVEAQRSEAATYPDSTFPDPASALVDAERKAGFEEADAHFVSGYFLTFLWLPPAEEAARAETWLYEGREQSGVNPHELLRGFIDRTDRVLALLDGFMPESRWLDDAGTLTYLHSTISTNRHRVRVPEVPMYLDALLADQPLTGGLEPRLGAAHLRVLTIVGFPTATTPGMLDEMNRLPFPYRWSTRAILLDKTDATRLLTRIRRQWFAKRKSVAAILKEVMTNEASALVDTDAANKALDADMALQELGADFAGMAYVTATVTVWDADPRLADEKLRLVEKIIQGRDFTVMAETVNAVDAWLGSLPGHAYANVRQPPISTLNLAHMIPLSAVWAGPERDEHFGDAPLLYARTEGSTPFRLSLHVGDVGHTLVVGPIDSGFGLLSGEVAFIATTLIVIDVTLAALFWAWGADDDIIARLVKKTLFVGVFAYIISNWNNLARIVFESFAGLGLMASGTSFSVADLMRPGRVAQTGLDAGRPLLDSISDLMGWISFFENFIQIACLLFAWALVVLAFFILAIQLFVTLIEFKLTTLAGFVLIPFGLFGKTAFMAEKVLGNVVSSGIKVLVLAVIIGIGSTLFSQFTAGFGGATPTIDDAMAIVLAALSLLGLGIFGPGIANGIVSGGPQLGAGAAVGTGLAAGGAAVAAGGGAMLAAKGGAAALSGGAAAVRGGAATAGTATAAYSLGSLGQTGAAGVASGLGGVARAAGSAAISPLKRAAVRASESVKSSFSAGAKAGFGASGGTSSMGTVGGASADSAAAASGPAGSPPAWAQRMRRSQAMNHGTTMAAHAVRSGDSHGSGSSVNLSESDRS